LSGDILEGGFSLAQLMDTLEHQPMPFNRAVLEMALTVEYAAYDLYRNLAHQFRGEKMEEVCETVAEAEKEHMRFVAKVLM
jgi:sulfur-carrier protein adenylyltransferase/sulfurtransferase